MWIIIAIILSPFFSVFLLTRSFVLSPIVTFYVRAEFGNQLVVKGASIDWNGGMYIREAMLRSEGVRGEAANVISVQDVHVTFDSSLPIFGASITDIDIGVIRVRLAESIDQAGKFNFSSMLKSAGDTDTSNSKFPFGYLQNITLPRIVLHEFLVETGIMLNDAWTLDDSMVFSITAEVIGKEKATLQLVDLDDTLSMELQLSTSPFVISTIIDDVQLDNSIFTLLPRTAKAWCKETNLQGGIKSLGLRWDLDKGIQIIASVEDIQFELPEAHGISWAAYREGHIERVRGDAKLDVKSGVITYDGNSVHLHDIQGLLVPPQQENSNPLGFTAQMKIYNFESVGEQQGEEWMESMLTDSPFEATFTIDDFMPNKTHRGDVVVPLAAAQMLNIFQLEHLSMNAKVSLKRDAIGEEVSVSGDLLIKSENGKYEYFPYPLKNINALIAFQKNNFDIVYLNADGSEKSKVHISGSVKTSADILLVDLDLHAEDAPLDNLLRDALSDQIAGVMNSLIDQKTYERVSDSLDNLHGPVFQLGGTLDLDLHITHDNRIDSGVVITGLFAFENVGILHEVFPYPVVLRSGEVMLDEEGLHIPKDGFIRFEGHGGGFGLLAGSIIFLEDGGAIPVLAIELENEWVTTALVEAISDSAGDSYELAAGILGGLGLSARLNMSGTVIGSKEGDIDTSFTIEIDDGTAELNEKLSTSIHASGPFWPEGFEFTGIEAVIQIVNGVVTMDGVTCQCGDGSLNASMSIDKGEFDLIIRGEKLPISPRLMDVLPSSASKKLSNAWRWFKPSGEMDAVIRMSHSGDASELHMTIDPHEIHVSGMDRSTVLELSSGSIVIEGTNVFFNNLEFGLEENGLSQGVLEILGEVHGDESSFSYFLDASWIDAIVDSPFTRSITGIVGGESGVDYFDSIHPSGRADAILWARGDEKGTSYNIEIKPTALSATFQDRRAIAVFEDENENAINMIRFDNNGMHFDYLLGKLGVGDFSLDGKIISEENVSGKFDLSWSGPTGDSSLFAILPSIVGDTLLAIEISDGQSVLPNGSVHFSGDSWDKLRIIFDGNILLDDVSINVGIPLKNIKGITSIVGSYSEENLSALELSLVFEELTTLGRLITDIEGRLKFDPNTNKFVFAEMRGESTTGGVAVDGWIGLGDLKEYEIEILIAGVELATGEGENVVATLEGDLKGWLSIAGVRGDSASRRGVGKIQVENGHLEIDPLSLTTMRLLQLSFPTASTIEGAEIDLYIDGDRIILEDITLRSHESDISALVLEGKGTIDFETFHIKARLHPRAGLPIIRDIAGAFNDQLYSIDVTGELLDPQVTVVPLPFLSPQE